MCRIPIVEKRESGAGALQSLDPARITDPFERRMVIFFQERLAPGARQPVSPPAPGENASGGFLNDGDEAYFEALLCILWGSMRNLERALHERRRLSENGT